MKSFLRKTTAIGLATSLLSFSLPVVAMAQAPGPELHLKPVGSVEVWNAQTNTWDPYLGGVAHEGQTFRAIEGGSLHGTITGEGPAEETIHLHSCSAIRFIKLRLDPHGNTIYGKAFGMITSTMSQDRSPIDDLKLEYPVGLEVLGRDVAGSASSGLEKTVFQTPTAREARLAMHENTTARMQGLSYVAGTVESIDPASGTFKLKEDINGRVDTVTLKGWSQLAKPTLSARVANETPAQIASQLTVGEKLTIYGVATAAQTGSLPVPGGMGAFAQTTPINFIATVVFPDNGLYIFGGTFVLSSPITPQVGQGVVGNPTSTLSLAAGNLQAALLPGIQLLNVACEIGNEAFVVPPPGVVAPVAGGAGLGDLPIYILLGAGAAALLNNHGNSNPILNASP